jgi:apolipoprotein N-acyltransferase
MPFRALQGFRRAARPTWRRIATAAVLGAAMAAGQAPLGFWWLTLPAFVLLIGLVAGRERATHAIWLGWAAGCGYFAASLFWIVEPFFVDAARDGWMAPFAMVLMAGGMALFWALAAGLSRLGGGGPTRAMAFVIGLALTDLLRSYVLTGFPWALVGHVWIGTPVMQMAAFVGPIGLSALTGTLAVLPHLARGARRRIVLTGGAAAVLAAVWVGGSARLAAPEPVPARPVMVRLVQPNAAQHLKWRADMWRVFLDRQMVQTATPPARPLDLIVWPETAVPFMLDRVGGLFEEITALSGGVPVALGIQRSEGRRFFNSLVVLNGTGQVTQVYDKWHLVPFGEYIPLGDLLSVVGITAFASREGSGYSPGPGARVLDLGHAGKVLPLICYEAVFPQDIAAAPERADWMLQVTNDSWFGAISGPYQHLAQARLRTVEQGLPLLRSGNTGISAVIDAKGRVLASQGLDTEGFIDAAVPAALPPTLYARTGDLPATILLLLALLALWAARKRLSH